MLTALTLICHAATRSMREGGFPARDEPLDEGGLRKAAAARIGAAGARGVAFASDACAARQTAEALGLAPVVDAALRDIDHGRWAGLGFAEAHADDPERFAAWIADPAAGAPGGETLQQVVARADAWLRRHEGEGQPLFAVTHPMVVRAMLAAALDSPPAVVLRIDIAPLATVNLSHNRIWRLQAIVPPKA